MTAALRCVSCGVIFAPFVSDDPARDVAANYAAHACVKREGTRAHLYPGMVALATRARNLNGGGAS